MIKLIDLPPGSDEFHKVATNGHFKSATIKKPILTPKGDEIFLTLKENDLYTIKTSVGFLQEYLVRRILNGEDDITTTGDVRRMLKSIEKKNFEYIQTLISAESEVLDYMRDLKPRPRKPETPVVRKSFRDRLRLLFKKENKNPIGKSGRILRAFIESAYLQPAIYIFDSQSQQYSLGTDYYEIMYHPTAAVGNSYEYFSYRGNVYYRNRTRMG